MGDLSAGYALSKAVWITGIGCFKAVGKLVVKHVVIHRDLIIHHSQKLSTIYSHVTQGLLTGLMDNLLIFKWFICRFFYFMRWLVMPIRVTISVGSWPTELELGSTVI